MFGDLAKIYQIVKTGADIYSTVKKKTSDRSPTPLIEEPSLGGMFELSSSGMEQAKGPSAPDVTNYEDVLTSWLQRITRFTQ
jgi:hypothetical protein